MEGKENQFIGGVRVQIVELSIFWTVVIDILAWAAFHIIISFWMAIMSYDRFNRDSFLYRITNWEKSFQPWERIFYVKKWKHFIPDGTKIIQIGFEKKRLTSIDKDYLKRFIVESKRAELTHWLSILPSIFFFLWNPFWAGWVMVAYALIFNGPIIIAQRYNRQRLERVVARKRKTKASIEKMVV